MAELSPSTISGTGRTPFWKIVTRGPVLGCRYILQRLAAPWLAEQAVLRAMTLEHQAVVTELLGRAEDTTQEIQFLVGELNHLKESLGLSAIAAASDRGELSRLVERLTELATELASVRHWHETLAQTVAENHSVFRALGERVDALEAETASLRRSGQDSETIRDAILPCLHAVHEFDLRLSGLEAAVSGPRMSEAA